MAIGNPISLTSNVATKTISVIATASQSIFTVNGGYRINELAVFRNGVRLVDGRDFTARDGSIVTLLSAASEGDVLEFQVFDTFRVADAITPFDSDQTIAGNLNITGILSASQLGSVNFNLTSGIQTFHDVRVGGALTVAGTLTYEDTTNTNTVGLATFSGGMNISGVGATATTLNVTGVSTFAGAISVGDTISLGDHDKLRFGDGNDLQIYHDGSNSYIKDAGTGILILDASQVQIKNAGSTENCAKFLNDGAVELYYDNSKKLETKSDGVDITGELQCDSLDVDGNIDLDGKITFDTGGNVLKWADNVAAYFGTGDDLRIYHNAFDSYIDNSTNATGDLLIRNLVDDQDIRFVCDNGSGGSANYILCDGSTGEVKLYHYGTQKLETTATGVTVTGTLNATTALTQNGNALATNGKAIAMALIFG